MATSRRSIGFVATSNPEKARVFYEDTLGLELLETSPFALVFSDGGRMLRVQIVSELTPALHTIHGWQVIDIEREIAELTTKGVEFQRFERIQQNALGIWETPDGGKIAWFKDPDGNVLSLTQFASRT